MRACGGQCERNAVASERSWGDHVRVWELPSGTVTRLFSDVEGSTAAVSRLGSQYPPAVDAMRSALRSAWDAHGGVEMGTEGDSSRRPRASEQQGPKVALRGPADGDSIVLPMGGLEARITRKGIGQLANPEHDPRSPRRRATRRRNGHLLVGRATPTRDADDIAPLSVFHV